jgi:hypothetical protein
VARKPRKRKAPRKSGPKGGRPSSYRPEYCEQVYKLCLIGFTDERLAKHFSIGITTLDRWKKEHAAFMDAMTAGKVSADAEVAESQYKTAKGYEYEEEQAIKCKSVLVESGVRKELERVEVVKVRRFQPGNVTAQIFWLKNRQKEYWRDKQDYEHTGKDGGPVEMHITHRIVDPSAT